jgi:hypothetical protein
VSSDCNEEFTKPGHERISDADEKAGDETSQAARGPAEARAASEPTAAGPDSDQAAAARRAAIAAMLVRLGFLPAERATPDNPAVEVLAELLPPDAEVELCLTCREFSCSGPYEFAHTTGRFPDAATMRRGGGLRYPANEALVKGPRRDLVVCTQDAVYWTQSRARSEGEDSVALYSVPFSDILGASVRHPPKGVVEVYIDQGPTISFRVERDLADLLQAQVDQAAQSE